MRAPSSAADVPTDRQQRADVPDHRDIPDRCARRFRGLEPEGRSLQPPLTSWQIVEASADVAVFFAAFPFVAFSLQINGKPSGYYTNVGLLNHLPTAWRYALQVSALVANDVMTRYVKLRQERRAQS
jgi:hypothetical protein